MKRTKLIVLMMSLIAVFIVSSGAMATVKTQVWGYSYFAPPDTTEFHYKAPVLDLGTLGLWSVAYSGTGALSTTLSNATLSGNFPATPDYAGVGHIWSFDYRASISDSWTNMGYAAHTVTALAGANSDAGGTDGGPTVVYARYLRMGYNWTLASVDPLNEASVAGTGSMTATAVPEPGSILAALSILGPAGILFRRRK